MAHVAHVAEVSWRGAAEVVSVLTMKDKEEGIASNLPNWNMN